MWGTVNRNIFTTLTIKKKTIPWSILTKNNQLVTNENPNDSITCNKSYHKDKENNSTCFQILPINVSKGDKTFLSNALLGSGSYSILISKTLADKLNISRTIANVILIKLKSKSKFVNFSIFLCGDRNRNGGDVACYIRSAMSYIQKPCISEEIEYIFFDILSPKSKPIVVGIINQ